MPERKKNGKATIQDVAAAAGVSVMTVSRSIRGVDGVSSQTRTRVRQIAKEMNYLPNSNASALVRSSSKLIGISIPTLFNEVFADMMMGMRRTFEQAGYSSVVDTTDYDREREKRFLERLLAWQPAAIILTGTDQPNETAALIKERNIPCLQIWDIAEKPIDLCVGIDHQKAGLALGRYLAGLGYRKPAFIGRPMGSDTRADARFKSLETTFAEVGGAVPRRINVSSDNDFNLGAEGFGQIDWRDPPDLICGLNDHVAVGIMFAAEKAGRSVPEDLGIAGFNALGITEVLPTRLTTMETPRRELGLVGARNLLARLNGVAPDPVTALPCRIVEGQTTRQMA
ncbi:MAG: LacI family DNA-binding transcriptional regulator [Pseudomonadota bacterium]